MKKWQRRVIYWLAPVVIAVVSFVVPFLFLLLLGGKGSGIFFWVRFGLVVILAVLWPAAVVKLAGYWMKKEPGCKTNVLYLMAGLLVFYLSLSPAVILVFSIFHIPSRWYEVVEKYMGYSYWVLFISLAIYQVWLYHFKKKGREGELPNAK